MKKLNKTVVTVLVVLMCITALLNGKEFSNSLKTALEKCYSTLIPSLMTFMTLSILVCESVAGDTISKILTPVFNPIFRVNSNCTKIILMSFIGGYPSGAKMVNNALEKGEIDTNTANTLLCYCINPSPAYVILAVGIGIFNSTAVGVVIYLSHITVAMLLAFLLRPKTPLKNTFNPPTPFSSALVKAVLDSTHAMVNICGFFLTFSPLTQTVCSLFKNTALKTILSMLLDTTTAVYVTSQLTAPLNLTLTAFCVSLGGVSIWFQCMAMLNGKNINFKKIILFRFLHSLLTAALTYFIIRIREIPYIFPTSTFKVSTNNLWLSLCLVGCCVFFLFSLGRYKQ